MVLLYLELCEQVWGGSPATTATASSIETSDINTASRQILVLPETSEVYEESDGPSTSSAVKQRRDLLQVSYVRPNEGVLTLMDIMKVL